MNNLFNLEHKVAIVTGATRGIGKEIALGLAQSGADVVSIGTSSSTDTVRAVEATGRQCLELQADLSNMKEVASIIPKVVEHYGKVDILVNNAGIIRRNDALHFTEQDWDDVLDINLKAVFFLSQSFAKQFLAQKNSSNQDRAKIVNIASLLSFQGGIRIPSYTSSKSGLLGLTHLLACEWASSKININAIVPGYIITDNTKALREDKVRYEAILSRIPEGRWGNPEDLKGAAIFLASSASDYVNGTHIAVDGGWLAR